MSILEEFKQCTVFKTERLLIRQLSASDLPAFHEMQGDLEVMQYVAKEANTLDEDTIDLEKVMGHYDEDDNEFWVWAVVEHARNAVVGTVAIVKDKEDNWEIGYRFLRKEWGKGFATETVNGLVEFCEGIQSIQNLVAYADLRNVGSQRVLSKTGFVNLGIKYNDDGDSEDYIYSVNTFL